MIQNAQDPKAVRAAIKNFRRLLELEPRHRGHREQLARLYEADAQPKTAVREWLGLARDLRQDGFIDDAVAAAREALRIEPGHEEAMTFLASVYAGAPRGALVRTVTAAVEEDPLDEMARPEREAPLDAMALVKVYSADEAGAELASQSSIDLSLSVSMGGLNSPASPDGTVDQDDGRVTVDLLPVAPPNETTIDLDELQLIPEGDASVVTVAPVAPAGPPDRRGAVATPVLDDPEGTVDIDVELFVAAEASAEASGEDASANDGSEDAAGEGADAPNAASAPAGGLGNAGGGPHPNALLSPLPIRPPMPNVPLFSALPRASIVDLLQRADRRFFPAATELLCVGEAVDGLYVVLSGTVRLTVRSHDGRAPVEVGLIEAGGFFGEADLLEGRASQVNVRAVDDVEILKISTDKVAFLRRHFPAFERTLDEAGELNTVSRYLAASALFGAIPPRDRATLAARFRPIALGPGEELFAEGAAPEGLYLVTRGSLIVYREGHTLTNLQAGEFIGVVSMLRQEPAHCTALAGPSAQVVCLDPDEVELILSSWQSVREAFWREARNRSAID